MQGWEDYDIHEPSHSEYDNDREDGEDGEDEGGDWDDWGERGEREQKFEATFEQQVHSSEQNDCGPLIIKEHGKEDEYRKAMSLLDPTDRLKQLLGSIVYSLNYNNILEISSNERNEICRSVNNLGIVNIQVKYVNPLAYVLGYIAYHKNLLITDTDTITKKKNKATKLQKEIFNNLGTINTTSGGQTDYSVFPPDVVRYMKLWSRIVI